MKQIYVFGHKNPDTDSVCSAIALAYLKNMQGIPATPKVIGQVNNGTKYVLNYFNTPVPSYLNDVKVQIKDLKYEKGAFINEYESIGNTIKFMKDKDLNAIPLVDEKKILTGYINLKDVVNYLALEDKTTLHTSLKNILELLDGTILCGQIEEVLGKTIYITCSNEEFSRKNELDENTILVVGDRYHIIENAISKKVKLIILTRGRVLPERLLKKARKNNVTIITCNHSTAAICFLLPNTGYIKNLCNNEGNLTTVNIHSYYTDFLSLTKRISYTNYPVVKDNNECLGVIKVTHMNEYEKKKVILVDHNNSSQSVDGLEESEILEVIDHHNIGDINTKKPINFRNAGVGSVNTIIYDLYKENNIKIPKDIAGLMASAIISDTLLLTSPTTTIRDTDALINLSKIAKIKYKKYGIELLKQGMTIKGLTNEDILHKDFKTYKVNDKMIGIGQILTADFESMNKKINSLVNYLDEVSNNENIRVVTLFVTDIFENVSYCLYNRDAENIIKNSFDLKEIYEGVPLKDIVSRKIQIAPYIMDAIEKE